ncbi:MAG TPA: hypothetical protein VJG48_01690 [Candidatus Paceibacterota bacterium]
MLNYYTEVPHEKNLVTRRSDDYHACIEDDKGKWGCGRTPDEAVGNLVRVWPREFDIEGIKFE